MDDIIELYSDIANQKHIKVTAGIDSNLVVFADNVITSYSIHYTKLYESKLSDVHGRKIMYIASLVVFAVGSAIVSVSDNLMFLLTGRAIQGFGSSGIFPVAAATIGDRFTATERGKALGMLGAVYA